MSATAVHSCGEDALWSPSPLLQLKDLAAAGAIYQIKHEHVNCPRTIRLRLADGVTLDAIDGSFTHEHFRFSDGIGRHVAPGSSFELNEKREKLNFTLGVSYTVSTRAENQDRYESTYSATILKPFMIAKVRASLRFDAESGEILYSFKGNGVADIQCRYYPVNR